MHIENIPAGAIRLFLGIIASILLWEVVPIGIDVMTDLAPNEAVVAPFMWAMLIIAVLFLVIIWPVWTIMEEQ